MNNYGLDKLTSSEKKSIAFFSNLRWNGKIICPRCGNNSLYYLKASRYGCKNCRYNFSEFTGTYLSKLKVKPDLVRYLLNKFISGIPAYRIRPHKKYGKCDISTRERTYRLFRQTIYDSSLEDIQNLKLSGEIEVNEELFDNHNKVGIFGWGSVKQQNLVFGIYYKNEKIVTFPITDRKYEELVRQVPFIKNDRDIGSLYYYDEQPVYAILNMKKKCQLVGGNDYEKGIPITTIPQKNFNVLIRIEEFWYEIKNWLYHYKGVPKKYFPLYLKEIEFRFNNRFKDNIFHELSQLLVNSSCM
ncbi:MAG TPA: IS1595 family transposase [Nitrososphaeraceae archaeon]|nr:IS1595 family transposase [Nitrososphaeraceae archaeon]